MWIPKWVRDRKKGVETAVPTQVVSNEELVPRPASIVATPLGAVLPLASNTRGAQLWDRAR